MNYFLMTSNVKIKGKKIRFNLKKNYTLKI